MKTVINAKTLRTQLAEVMGRVQKGERFTVLYRSRPVCEVVPISAEQLGTESLEEDPLYQAKAIGKSTDRRTASDHDEILYGGRIR
jgi:antitoxin (DNA-binding transcriptional repressor) of toxin-antitoxin stability system